MARVTIVRPSKKTFEIAGEAIQNDEVVAFPTETVYGLAVSAFSARAAKKVFRIKGRSEKNPLLILIGSSKDLPLVAKSVPQTAKKLIAEFWPGPLTIIFKKTNRIPRAISGGTNTIAVRLSSHKVPKALIEAAGVPITATSANISGKESHKTAAGVRKDLGKRGLMFIIDGGRTKGSASTIVDVTKRRPVIIREGAISKKEIEKVLE